MATLLTMKASREKYPVLVHDGLVYRLEANGRRLEAAEWSFIGSAFMGVEVGTFVDRSNGGSPAQEHSHWVYKGLKPYDRLDLGMVVRPESSIEAGQGLLVAALGSPRALALKYRHGQVHKFPGVICEVKRLDEQEVPLNAEERLDYLYSNML